MIDLKREEKKMKVGAQAFVTFFTSSPLMQLMQLMHLPPLSLIQLSKSNI